MTGYESIARMIYIFENGTRYMSKFIKVRIAMAVDHTGDRVTLSGLNERGV